MNFDVLRDLIYACEMARFEAMRQYVIENVGYGDINNAAVSSVLPEALKPRFILIQPDAYEALIRRHEIRYYYDQVKREIFGLKLIVTRNILNPVEIV